VLPHRFLEEQLRRAIAQCLPDADTANAFVRPCVDTRFGDYQTSALMALAKERRMNPRQLATEVLAKLELPAWVQKAEIAGAGFINFHLDKSIYEEILQRAAAGEHLFFEKTARPKKVVVDFSSPNVAKPMHVGHIRSTILGDCLARVLRLLGHQVVTDNHIGDWGTQFGMLLVGWKQHLDRAALEADPVLEMERLYRKVNAACQADSAVLESARAELVRLQSGDPENLGIWREMIALSQAQFDTIYRRLGVSFDHALGESFYNPRLKAVVAELRSSGLARESEGAVCVFSDGTLPPKDDPLLIQKEGEWQPNPCLVQKSDGGFNYATTDLATLAYRIETWTPDTILYVTDSRQQLHFQQLFHVFGRWHPEAAVTLKHVWFGTILGEDGKPFRTRSGETIKLAALLDEAEERALAVVTEKNPELTPEARAEVARIVGIGAVKYADLLPNRQSDYVFSWDKLLALNGNTAPYLQYACARIRSIFRKAGEGNGLQPAASIRLSAPDELTLARHLMSFGIVLEAVLEDYRPNYLCNYLFELAGYFARFYESCPVLKAGSDEERASRLWLCELTARVLAQGLETLGIETPERM
jgi:arginyl-tRNA synthetase